MGHAANLEVKTEGDNSMLRKQGSPEGMYGRLALQDLRDMVRATLPEPQFPVAQAPAPRTPCLEAGLPLNDVRGLNIRIHLVRRTVQMTLRAVDDEQRVHSRGRTRHLSNYLKPVCSRL